MNLKGLQGDAVVAKDGEIGPVTDAYFDDQRPQVPMSVAAARRQGASALRDLQEHAAEEREAADSHLRSSAEVIGYAIEAADGPIGHVEDFLVDESSWALSGMIVDTRNWLPGGKVVLPPSAVADIDWQNKKVKVRLTREEIKSSRAP
jgi:uncharacterized protein YrrD